jgi:hypothetical protein
MALDHKFKPLPGGLYAAVAPFNKADFRQRRFIDSVASYFLGHEANVHGASFDSQNSYLTRAILSGRVEVILLYTAWRASEQENVIDKRKITAVMFNSRNLFMRRNGEEIDINHGVNTLDTCLSPRVLRALIGQKPPEDSFPPIGLGQYFEQESLNYLRKHGMSGGVIPAGRAFEFDPGNTKIIRIQKELNATLGARNSGVFKMEGLTQGMVDVPKVPVSLIGVTLPDGSLDPHNFVVRWHSDDNRQKIYTSFGDDMSSFIGNDRTECQIVTNGNLPNESMVKSVIASSLIVGHHKIAMDRLHAIQSGQPCGFNPALPLIKYSDREEFKLNRDEVVVPFMRRTLQIGDVPAHVHLLHEPEIVAAVHSLDMEARLLGGKPTQPGRIEFAGEFVRPQLVRLETSGILHAKAA